MLHGTVAALIDPFNGTAWGEEGIFADADFYVLHICEGSV
jgi:hypothetical protein